MKLQVQLSLFSTLLAATCWAGPGASGGGRGVVCRSASGKIESVELLDLWEGKHLYNRKIVASYAPVAQQVDQGLERLKFALDMPVMEDENDIPERPEHFFLRLAHAKADLFLNDSKSVRRLHNVHLQPTPDSDEPAVPAERRCQVEQLVNYFDSQTAPMILVNQDLVEKMDATNAAALIVHEVFYAILRDESLREASSVRTRRAVGYVFSGESFPSIARLLGANYVRCSTSDAGQYKNPDRSSIYFFRNDKGLMKILVGRAFGQMAIGFFEPDDAHAERGGLDFYTPDGYCKDHDDGNTMLWSTIPGWGPVDFTRTNGLTGTCYSKSLILSLSRTEPEPLTAHDDVTLACQSMQPPSF